MSNGVYCWVIRSIKREEDTFRNHRYFYFANRTSIKNPRFVSGFHWHVKWFSTKAECEEYYFAKSRFGHDVSGYKVTRKKLFLDKKGNYDYFKNRESLK